MFIQRTKQALFEAFKTYALLGGMPEIIQSYKHNKDVTLLEPIYDALINSYLQDAEKYAKNEAQLHLIRFSIQQAMLKAGHLLLTIPRHPILYKNLSGNGH